MFLLANYRGRILTVEPHLTVFSGFEKLEAGKAGTKTEREGKYSYPSQRAAFDAASVSVDALFVFVAEDDAAAGCRRAESVQA